MDLFVCGTAYQLLNLLSISAGRHEQADLIITDPSMRQICKAAKIRQQCNISRVYVWDTLAGRVTYRNINHPVEHYLNNVKKALLYSQIRGIYRSLPNQAGCYDRIWIGNPDFPAMCIYYYFKQKGASLSLYEEGAFTYNCMVLDVSYVRRWISHLLFGGYILDDCQEIWVRNIRQISLGKRQDIRLFQIPDNLPQIRPQLMDIFYYNRRRFTMLDKKILLFDEVHEVQEIYDLQQKAAEMISLHYENDYVIKYHPGVSSNRYRKGIRTVRMGLPFEVFLGIVAMDEKILVSLFSTACFSPKLMYDQEPYVIFLYKLLRWKNPFAFDQEVKKLKQSYRKPDRIMEPETLEEMIQCIDSFMKQSGEKA